MITIDKKEIRNLQGVEPDELMDEIEREIEREEEKEKEKGEDDKG